MPYVRKIVVPPTKLTSRWVRDDFPNDADTRPVVIISGLVYSFRWREHTPKKPQPYFLLIVVECVPYNLSTNTRMGPSSYHPLNEVAGYVSPNSVMATDNEAERGYIKLRNIVRKYRHTASPIR